MDCHLLKLELGDRFDIQNVYYTERRVWLNLLNECGWKFFFRFSWNNWVFDKFYLLMGIF